ncbi:MAG: PP2C family protein-serine/threonine phosphatase [Tepidisphaerales bacterium]
MDVHRHSEPGGHRVNEDAIAVVPHPGRTDTLICALADGQGGQSGGARAAQVAVETCLEQARQCSPAKLLSPFTWQAIGPEVDQSVMRDPEAGFTTFVGLAVGPGFVVGASCGDSAGVLLLGEKFVQLTGGQQKNPPIGSGTAYSSPFSARLDGPFKLLLMSDGVWKFTSWEQIAELCRRESGQELITAIRTATQKLDGRLMDDFSVILVEG